MTIQADNMWFGVLALIGGLGLFLFGMTLMGEGLQLAAGDRMRKMLEKLTKGRIRGVFVGAGITSLIQSSSATTVMLIAFVNAGLMTFTQSVAVILGADIGTTITAQIVAFKVETLVFPFIAAGLIMYLVGNRRNIKYTGEVILGFGILFLGMVIMKGAMHPLQVSGTFENWISSYGQHWILGLLFGILITSIVQSSSATTGMLIAMAAAGVLGTGPEALRIAIPVVLGCNIGTCITAAVASIGTSISAQRVAVAHYLFKITGVILFLPFLKWYPDLVIWVSDLFGAKSTDIARQIAWSHTIFNVLMTLIWLPFMNQFIKLVKFIRKGEAPIAARDPLYLDPRTLKSPDLALEMAKKEITRMARVSHEMLKSSVGFLAKIDKTGKKALLEEENIVDSLANEITNYLTRLSEETLTDEQSEQMVGLMHAVNDLERIGDHAENIMYLAASKQENSQEFGSVAVSELAQISDKVLEMNDGMIRSFETGDPQMAAEFQTYEGEIDSMASTFRRNHINRQSVKECDLGAGVVFLDVLTNLERVGDLTNNVGHVVTGELERI